MPASAATRAWIMKLPEPGSRYARRTSCDPCPDVQAKASPGRTTIKNTSTTRAIETMWGTSIVLQIPSALSCHSDPSASSSPAWQNSSSNRQLFGYRAPETRRIAHFHRFRDFLHRRGQECWASLPARFSRWTRHDVLTRACPSMLGSPLERQVGKERPIRTLHWPPMHSGSASTADHV